MAPIKTFYVKESLYQNIFKDILVIVYSFNLISNMSVNLKWLKFGRRILGQGVEVTLKTVKNLVLRAWNQLEIQFFIFVLLI